MLRIIKIGMDVHTTNYTLCAIEPSLEETEKIILTADVAPECKNIINFIEQLKNKLGNDNQYEIECGYEAGCLGYSLHKQLTSKGITCTILAPTTMLTNNKRVKTDSRDALTIAKCLAYKGYSAVYVPDEQDESMRDYIRMRNDHKDHCKSLKQQINSFCLRRGHRYEKTLWTEAHLLWLRNLEFADERDKETLEDYYVTYEYLESKIERLDKRIEEWAEDDRYREKAKRLICFKGVKTHTAMALISEVGDFERFSKGSTFAAYLGLVPGEHSSGDSLVRTSITKAGNKHLRTLLVEAAQGIIRGRLGHKSKELKKRQLGNTEDVITYADKANERLKHKYSKMQARGKKYNVAVTAVARELACFVWGMMTDNIDIKTATSGLEEEKKTR